MPYKTNKDLPDRVRKNLPMGAQSIYRKAFNSSFEQYDEITAHKVAWSAVKKKYEKKDGRWVKN